jgi:maltose alpha-D-glucosyltransferase/alpha-amylase
MIRLRTECPEIGWGDWEILRTGVPSVLAIRYDWRGNALVVVHNFADQPQEVRIKPGVEGDARLVNLLVRDESHADETGVHRIALEASGYRWYRVGSLNHILRRTKE